VGAGLPKVLVRGDDPFPLHLLLADKAQETAIGELRDAGMVAEDVAFTGGSWQAFEQETLFTFSDATNGLRTVFVKFRDTNQKEIGWGKGEIVLETEAPPPDLIPQTGWSLWYVDSEELVGEFTPATYAFDGNSGTFWHTEWFLRVAPLPHEIQINLGDVYELSGFRYLPRTDGNQNGRIADYEFYDNTLK